MHSSLSFVFALFVLFYATNAAKLVGSNGIYILGEVTYGSFDVQAGKTDVIAKIERVDTQNLISNQHAYDPSTNHYTFMAYNPKNDYYEEYILVTIDANTGKILYEPVLNMKVVYFLYNLEYDVATSILYGILSDNDGGETVVSVDIQTGNTTAIHPFRRMTVDSAIFFDSTFDPVKKIYYLLTEYQSYWTVLGVDVIKGTIAVNTTLLDINLQLYPTGLEINHNNGIMYTIATPIHKSYMDVAEINMTSGVLTYLNLWPHHDCSYGYNVMMDQTENIMYIHVGMTENVIPAIFMYNVTENKIIAGANITTKDVFQNMAVIQS